MGKHPSVTTGPAGPFFCLDASSPLRTVAGAECVPAEMTGTQLAGRWQPVHLAQQLFVHATLCQRLAKQLDRDFLYLIQVRHFHHRHLKLC